MTHLTAVHHERESPVGDEARLRLRVVVPHIRRAVAIAKLIELHRIDAGTLAEAVDAIAAGVFLVGQDLNIVRVNVSGRGMLDAREILRAQEGRLLAVEAATGTALREAVSGAASGDVAIGSRGPAILLESRNGDRYVMHVLPLVAGRRQQAPKSNGITCRRYRQGALERSYVDQAVGLVKVPLPERLSRNIDHVDGRVRRDGHT